MLKQLKIFTMAVVLLIFFIPRVVSAEEVIIFHTNDTHCRISESDDGGKSIGLAEMAAAVKTVKKQNKNTFWLDAGDAFQGLPKINVSKGENLVAFLNAAGVDLMVPGNHEFDYGSDQLENLARKLKFPVISANIVRKNNGESVFAPYKIFKRGNIKIGVFGLTTPETRYTSAPKNTETLDFLNPVETANEMIKILRPQCDILIAVTHMGLDKSSEFTSRRIAAETEGIDLIIDGHSHTELHEALIVGNTLIAQTGSYSHYLGQVKINLRDGKIISKESKLLNDAEVAEIAPVPDKKISKLNNRLEERNKRFLGEILTESNREISGERELVRREETEMGDLCADALRWKSGADIAVFNGGGIRTGLPSGVVTRGDILAIMPFGNGIQKNEVLGKNIRAMLERSVSAYPEELGGFLSVSGMNFSFDPSQPAGQRVQEIFINGEILDENKIYVLAASDFIFSGGDGYTMLKDSKIIGKYGIDSDVLAEYINSFGTDKIEGGRIEILDNVEEKQAA